MSGSSPDVVLYDASGNALATTNGAVAPTSAITVAGYDGTDARFISTNTSGQQVIVGAGTAGTGSGGVLTVQGATAGIALPVSGTVTANAGTGSFTVVQATAANLNATVTGTVAATQSGTWTVQPGNTANTTPWLATINQGGNSAAVKPASTAAVATDPALVVSISPNNSLSTSAADVTATGALGALNAAITLTHPGQTTIGLQLAAGTLIGTLVAETSFDGGTTWNPTYFNPTNGAIATTIVFASANTATAATIIGVGGAGETRVRVSAYTSGTANGTIRGSHISDPSTLTSAAIGTATPLYATQFGGSDGTNIQTVRIKPASTAAVATDPALVVTVSPNSNATVTESDQLTNSSYPDPSSVIVGTSSPTIDAFGNLQTRGTVLTDEGSLRDDFTGSALTTALTGTVTFTNGSTAVTGSGTAFTTQVNVGQYIKKTADSETLYVQVSSIESDTALTLDSNYTGTSGGAASVVSNWQTVTGTGTTLSVASSIFSWTAGTTANSATSIRSLGDFLPYSVQFYVAVSQRIANQTFYMGFQDVVGLTPNQQVTVQFSGTTNTQVNFVTCYANTASDTQTTLVTIPNGSTTATYHLYKIDISQNQATLSIDGIVVAINSVHIPSPYTVLYITAGSVNGATAPASSTTFDIDYIFFQNIDRVQIDQDFNGEPLPFNSVDKSGTGSIAALNGTVVATTGGCSTVTFDVLGTWSETLVFEGTNGDGTWVALQAWNFNSQALVSNITTNQTMGISCGGFTQVRVRASAYTSGTANIQWNAGAIGGSPLPVALSVTVSATNQGTPNTLANGWPVKITDGSNTMPTMDIATRAGYMHITDGSNLMPMMDNVIRPGFQKITDGSNTMPTMDNIIRPGFQKITDGSNVTTIKGANTAAVAGDTALVVAISPNNGFSQGTPNTLSNAWPVKVTDGSNTMPTMDIATRAGYMHITDGSNLMPMMDGLLRPGFQKITDGSNLMPTMDSISRPGFQRITDGSNLMPTMDAILRPGFQKITDGNNTATVKAGSTAAVAGDTAIVVAISPNNGFTATGAAASGSAVTGNPVLMGASDGTDARTLITNPVNAVQSLQVQNAEHLRKTYSASFTVATAATATDIATIIGSASTVVRVTKIELTGLATTAVTTPILLIKRSAADTGGTSTTATAIPHDANDAAATAVVSAYTANPTGLGAAVGTIRSTKMVFPLTGVLDSVIIWEFGIRNNKPIVLRGVAQNLAINLNSITVTGGSVSGFIEWTEDAT